MYFNYALMTLLFLYASGWIRTLFKRRLRGLRKIYIVLILSTISSCICFLILLIDILASKALDIQSETIATNLQYNYILPFCLYTVPDLAYIGVVSFFYIISATVVDTTVYESVDNYLKNYESHPEKIIYMCFNILSQGLLLTIGYFSLFITLIKLTTWKEFVWDDPGFILVISSILAGAMKFPKRDNQRWNDLLLNSYSIFSSAKMSIIIIK